MPGKDQPTEVDVINAAIAVELSRFQCSFPAIVTELEAPDGRVTVQPAIRIRTASGQQLTPKPVTIPVGWFSLGDLVIQGVLAIGDEVRVECMDKNWSAWLLTGGVVDDRAIGGHSAGYAVAVPCQMSVSRRPPPMAPTDALRIGRKDGLATMVIAKDGTITMQGVELKMTAGDGFSNFLTTLHTAINGWVPVANDGGAALKTALAAWLALTPPTGGGPPP